MSKVSKYFKTNTIITLVVLFGIFIFLKWKTPADLQRRLTGTKIDPAVQLADFQLSDGDGQPFDKSKLKGRWTVVTFGFTQCPDVCPMTLGYFRDEIAKLDPDTKKNTQFVFVSVDPEHDTPSMLKKYVGAFDPSIVPVTGPIENLKQFAAIFFTHFQKTKPSGAAEDLVALTHNPNFFVIDPEANWQLMYAPPMPEGTLAADLSHIEKANAVF